MSKRSFVSWREELDEIRHSLTEEQLNLLARRLVTWKYCPRRAFKERRLAKRRFIETIAEIRLRQRSNVD